MKVAIVHDQLTQYGGAERVLEVLHEIYPEAPIYTTLFLKEKLPAFYQNWTIKTTFIDKLPIIRNIHQLRTLLFSLAISTIKLENYDLVISYTQGIAKGVSVPPGTYHLSYINTVPWVIWGIKKVKGRFLTKYFGKKWDYKTAQNPNSILSISQNTHDRIKKFYNRDSHIIYPPVEIKKLQNSIKSYCLSEDIKVQIKDFQKNGYYIFVGRLEGYKGELEFAHALSSRNRNLLVLGSGTNKDRLTKFGEKVVVISGVSDEDKALLVLNAKALLNGSDEDFGINMVEALCLGTPVIALGKGGALEIIQDEKNGLLLDSLEQNEILDKVKKIEEMRFNKKKTVESSLKFSRENFINDFKEYVSGLNIPS